jgi:hypothetical protein
VATAVFTDAEMTAIGVQAAPASDWDSIVKPAWTASNSINGASGVVTYSAPASPDTILLQVFRLLADDATIPPVITMTNLRMQFTWTVTCPGGNATISEAVHPVAIVGAGSGSFDENNDPTFYWGGTDRTTLFTSPALWEVYTTSASASQSIAISAFTLTVTYTTPTVPAVTSVTPSSGSINGGQSVTIRGEGFTAATGVEFGGIAATSVVIVDDATITAVTPAHLSGLVDVEVLSVATGVGLYTYVVETIRLPPMPVRSTMTQGGARPQRGRRG